MSALESLEIGQEISIENDEGQVFKGQLKKMKDTLIAVSMHSGLQNKESLATGASIHIKIGGDDGDLPAVIKQDKAFPLLVMSIESDSKKLDSKARKMEREDIEDLISSLTDPEFVRMRDSARIEDSFPIEFYKQTPEMAEQKRDDYFLRPTHERRESFKLSSVQSMPGFSEAALRSRIAHLDNVLKDVILDLYRRVAACACKGVANESDKPLDEAIGICVDISGTGFRILTSQKLKPGDILKVIVAPPLSSASFSVSCLVQVRRVSRIRKPDPPDKKYAVGVKYYAIHEDDMEMIIRYTFQLQRDFLKQKRQVSTED